MAVQQVQAVDLKSGEKTEVPEAINNNEPTINGKFKAEQAVTDAINTANKFGYDALNTANKYGHEAAQRGQSFLDRIIPPEKRAALLEKGQEFVSARPKLAAFLGLNLLLTGIPLVFFILFSISTFVVSLVVAVLTALLTAVTFTLFSVGAALLVLLPTIFLTTFVACSLFLWGLAAFYIYTLIQRRREGSSYARS